MTGNRLLWMALPLVVGVALLGTGLSLHYAFAHVAWEAPVIAVAVTTLIARGEVDSEAARDGLALFAATALALAAAIGGRAVWLLFKEVWNLAAASPGPASFWAKLDRFPSFAGSVWHTYWGSISFVIVLALLPALGAVGLGVRALKRLLADSREVEGGPWSAKWMTSREARYLAQQKVGLPLGRLNGVILRFQESSLWRGGHHMLVAGTRAGKGVSAVLPAIIDHPGWLFAIDIKGELTAVTQRHRRSLGQHVVVLDPLGVLGSSVDGFNPLDFVRNDPDHIAADAAVIAEGLIKPETGPGEHFSTLARDLIAAAIEVVVKIAEHPDERNLSTVADMLGPNVIATLEAWQDRPEVVGTAATRVAAAVLGAGDKERGSILTTVSKAFAWTSSVRMQRFLKASTFDLTGLLDGKTDVFLVVPPHQLTTLSVFVRLMVNIIMGVVLRDWGKHNLEKPLLTVLDEFIRLGRMQMLLDIATLGAGAGIECLFVTQDRAQIASVYRDGEADTLLGSCATVRVWGLGRTDNATAEWVVSGVGDRTVQTHSKPLDGKHKGSESEQRTKLLTPDELLELPASDMVALFPGRPPLRLQRIISHQDPEYQDKLDPNPTLRTVRVVPAAPVVRIK